MSFLMRCMCNSMCFCADVGLDLCIVEWNFDYHTKAKSDTTAESQTLIGSDKAIELPY